MRIRQVSPAVQPIRRKTSRLPTGLRNPALMALIGGAALLLLTIYFLQVWSKSRPAFHYSPSDVVYGQTLHATHQMEGRTSLTPPASGHHPRVEIPSGYFDFGSVAHGQVAQQVLPVINRGDAPLMITSAHTTCGCTTADFTATQIPPGKVALVTITFDSAYHDLRGQTVRRGIVIETNDPQNPSVTFWFQITVR